MPRHAGGPIIVVSLGFLLGPPFFLGCVFPPVVLQALMLCGAVIVWRGVGRGPSLFYGLSLGSTLVAYVVAGGLAWQTEREYAEPAHPLSVGIDGRPVEADKTELPEGWHSLPPACRGSPGWSNRLSEGVSGYREFQLRRLHEHAIELFINSPGFGDGRMMPA